MATLSTLSLANSEPSRDLSGLTQKQINRLSTRYDSAYTVAKVVVILGSVVRFVGVLVGALVAIAGVMIYLPSGRTLRPLTQLEQLGIGGCVAAGVLLAIAGLVFGTLVIANGQRLRAALDGAVNSSPLLSNSHKAEILGL